MIRKEIKLQKGSQYHNLYPSVRLIGDTGKTNIIVEWVSDNGLIYLGAQISTNMKSFTKALELKNYRWVTGYRRDRRNRGTI